MRLSGKERRKYKRIVNRLLRKCKVGNYFIDCRYHPCRSTYIERYLNDIWGCGVDGISLINEQGTSCSFLHCGPEPISQQVAEEMAKTYKDLGADAYFAKYFPLIDQT